MPAPVYRKLSPKSIIVLLRPSAISKAIHNGSITFEEKRVWKSGIEDLAESRREARALPVLLADASKGHGVFAWGEAASIERSDVGTRVTLRKVRPVPSHPFVWSFRLVETGDFISQNDQRSYRRIFTPDFLIEAPRVFLFNWNPDAPDTVPLKEFRDSIEPTRSQSQQLLSPWSWRCYSTKLARLGDRFFLLRQGDAPRGIVASGWIRSRSWPDDDGTPHVNVWVDEIVDPDQPLLTSQIKGAEKIGDNVFKSGHRQVSADQISLVDEAWDKHCSSAGRKQSRAIEPNEQRQRSGPSHRSEDAVSSLEGRLVESTSNRRERNRENRQRCLTNYDNQRPPCVVCRMNFFDRYGLIGRGFIHVHHRRPTANYNEEGEELIPEKDLVPVCPNCHAMLHIGCDASKGEVRSIEELSEMLAAAKRQT